MKIQNKTIIITGSSDGIGKAIALRLGKEKANIALVARNEKKLREVEKEALKLGANKIQTYPCDIRNEESIKNTVNLIKSDFGEIDVLINNAGVWQKLMQADEISTEITQAVLETNLHGTINMTQMVLPHLRSNSDETAIINISSKSGTTAQAGQAVYTASKYGVRGFTEVLHEDLKGSSIRVAGIYQAGTNTEMFSKTNENFPVEKFTDPNDLADVVRYMLSLPEKIWLHDVRVEY